MHARAIFVRGLFAVSRIYSRFVRAIARFQRKFSVNHAKSAYFQRKSRKVSVNNHLPYKRCPPSCGKATVGGHSAFSDGLESLADDLAGVDNGQKGLRVLPAQEIPQQPCLPPGQRHHNHGAGLAGVHAGGVLLGRCASQCFRNEMPDGLRP